MRYDRKAKDEGCLSGSGWGNLFKEVLLDVGTREGYGRAQRQ